MLGEHGVLQSTAPHAEHRGVLRSITECRGACRLPQRATDYLDYTECTDYHGLLYSTADHMDYLVRRGVRWSAAEYMEYVDHMVLPRSRAECCGEPWKTWIM